MQRSELTGLGGARNWARDDEAETMRKGRGHRLKLEGPTWHLCSLTKEYNLRVQPLYSLLSMSKEAIMWLPPPYSCHRPLGA